MYVPSGQLVNSVQYVVFEFCRGSDLFNFLCTGPWEKTGKYVYLCPCHCNIYFTMRTLPRQNVV